MLVLKRNPGEKIVIRTKAGERIDVQVVEVNGEKVRLGIEADKSIEVHREEIFLERERRAALVAAEGVTP